MEKEIYSEGQILKILKKYAEENPQVGLASMYGVSPQFLSDVLKGRRSISSKLSKAMGFKRVIIFEKVK